MIVLVRSSVQATVAIVCDVIELFHLNGVGGRVATPVVDDLESTCVRMN